MPFQSWRADEDSLWISMGNGFTGVSSALAPEGPNWAGVLRNMSDMGGTQRYSRSIRLSEVDCESPPPALASRDTPVPHSIPVVDGPSLVLAAPVPEGYRLRTGQFMDLVEDVQLAGYWAGAEMVLVRRNRDGLISDIEVRYPDGHDPDIVSEGLAADFGPGTPGDFRLAWRNHSTSASLQYNQTRVLLIAWRMRY